MMSPKRFTTALLAAALLGAAFASTGCATSHIGTYTPKHREYQTPEQDKSEQAAPSPGSLWRTGQPASMLFTDARALRQNDLVVIKVEEIADARRSADTDLNRQAQLQADLTAFLKSVSGAAAKNLDVGLNANSGSTFKADGATARTERLTATVPATVKKVLPNGNLFVEGHRVVLVNAEEQHFYISGVVRPIDIEGDNSVKSSMLAEAEIEFTGRGVLTDNQHQGFLQRYFGWLWPF